MPRQAMLGNRVRRLRHRQGLTQVAMASQLGISPSYLNLIEHNQRALNRPLLLKLSECFDIDLQAFSGNEEARLLADITDGNNEYEITLFPDGRAIVKGTDDLSVAKGVYAKYVGN